MRIMLGWMGVMCFIVVHVFVLEHRMVLSMRNLEDDLLCFKYQMRPKIVLTLRMPDSRIPIPGRLEYQNSNLK